MNITRKIKEKVVFCIEEIEHKSLHGMTEKIDALDQILNWLLAIVGLFSAPFVIKLIRIRYEWVKGERNRIRNEYREDLLKFNQELKNENKKLREELKTAHRKILELEVLIRTIKT